MIDATSGQRAGGPTVHLWFRRGQHTSIVTTWVNIATADEVRVRAAEAGTTVSVIIAGIVARHVGRLHLLDPPPGGRQVTMASAMPLALAQAVRTAADACGRTRSQVIAAALAAELQLAK